MYIYIYYLIIFSLERGIYWRASEHLQDKISKHKDLNKFYKDHCRGLTTESDILQNCSFCEVWSVYSGQYLSKIIQRKNRGHGWPRLIDTSGAKAGPCGKASSAQTAENPNTHVHHSSLCMFNIMPTP